MVDLKNYKVNKIEIENRLKPGTRLKLQNRVKYNVNYMDDIKKCIGMLEFRIFDNDMNPFEIKIEMAAEFSFDLNDDKTYIHTASFDQLFPFLRMTVNTASSLTGMPGLIIPVLHLNRDAVTVGDPAGKEESPLN
ncbi:MAG: hypothetical protein LUG21_03695 [Clostridiales bacterium]|nr:hypothetical protein [Clostridiales bacterium]